MPKKRITANKTMKPVLHIYCEGTKTEPNYLKGYIAHTFAGARNLGFIKIEPNEKNTIQLLVDTAIKAKKGCPKGDIFWIICDRESPQNAPEELCKDAYQQAKKNNIEIALSNVCFEVWLLLHFCYHNVSYNSCEDLIKNSPLKNHLVEYKKADPTLFKTLKPHLDTARKNAEILNQDTLKTATVNNTAPYQLNPYTDVYKLLDGIDAFDALHLKEFKKSMA